jgi:hypothetical protein
MTIKDFYNDKLRVKRNNTHLTPKDIMDFAEAYHTEQLRIGGVVSTLNHEDLAVGEQVRITQIKLVEINCFREDGDIDVEDATSVFTVGIDEIQKVV